MIKERDSIPTKLPTIAAAITGLLVVVEEAELDADVVADARVGAELDLLLLMGRVVVGLVVFNRKVSHSLIRDYSPSLQ